MATAGLQNLSVDTSALRTAAGDGGLGGVAGQIAGLAAKYGLGDNLEFTDPSVTGFAVGIDLDAAYKACVDALVRGPDSSLATIQSHLGDLRTGLNKAADNYDGAHARHADAAGKFATGVATA